MPARASRIRDLHDHLVRSRPGRPPALARPLRQHPDWPTCPACLWPVDPAAGGPEHPNCEER